MSVIYEGKALRPFQFTHPTDRTPDETYVYVVSIASGVVKVGWTGSPQRRVGDYLTTAKAYGTEVDRIWISKPHLNARKTEAGLIDWGQARAASQVGNEFFTGIAFEDAVDCAIWLIAKPERASFSFWREPAFEAFCAAEVFDLDVVSARTGLSVEQIISGCYDGYFEHSLVDGKLVMAHAQIEALIDLLLPPLPDLIAPVDAFRRPTMALPEQPKDPGESDPKKRPTLTERRAERHHRRRVANRCAATTLDSRPAIDEPMPAEATPGGSSFTTQ